MFRQTERTSIVNQSINSNIININCHLIITNFEKGFNENVKKLMESQYWQSAMHTQSALRYLRERPLNEGKKVEDRSFILIWENEPVIAFHGATVETNTTTDLLAYEVPSISFENKVKMTAKAAKTNKFPLTSALYLKPFKAL